MTHADHWIDATAVTRADGADVPAHTVSALVKRLNAPYMISLSLGALGTQGRTLGITHTNAIC